MIHFTTKNVSQMEHMFPDHITNVLKVLKGLECVMYFCEQGRVPKLNTTM